VLINNCLLCAPHVSIRNCCNRPIIKNCYLKKGIAFRAAVG
jgi:hypothetical protein